MPPTTATTDPTATRAFDAWLTKVDARIQALAGLSLDDLTDCDTAGMFANHVSPAAAAHAILAENGFND